MNFNTVRSACYSVYEGVKSAGFSAYKEVKEDVTRIVKLPIEIAKAKDRSERTPKITELAMRIFKLLCLASTAIVVYSIIAIPVTASSIGMALFLLTCGVADFFLLHDFNRRAGNWCKIQKNPEQAFNDKIVELHKQN